MAERCFVGYYRTMFGYTPLKPETRNDFRSINHSLPAKPTASLARGAIGPENGGGEQPDGWPRPSNATCSGASPDGYVVRTRICCHGPGVK